jgi:low temperature requirement protein LtrA
MRLIEALYLLFSGTLAVAGLSMVGFAVRAYSDTGRPSMMHLSAGFGLVVTAAIGTTILAFLTDFERTRTLLTANYFLTTAGYVFVMYSILEPGS